MAIGRNVVPIFFLTELCEVARKAGLWSRRTKNNNYSKTIAKKKPLEELRRTLVVMVYVPYQFSHAMIAETPVVYRCL